MGATSFSRSAALRLAGAAGGGAGVAAGGGLRSESDVRPDQHE